MPINNIKKYNVVIFINNITFGIGHRLGRAVGVKCTKWVPRRTFGIIWLQPTFGDEIFVGENIVAQDLWAQNWRRRGRTIEDRSTGATVRWGTRHHRRRRRTADRQRYITLAKRSANKIFKSATPGHRVR